MFTPSEESGIGVNGRPKNTFYGLYRDGTELRGIYPSKGSNARKACKATGPFACDFPIIIGNDEYYGTVVLMSETYCRWSRRRICNKYFQCHFWQHSHSS